MDSRELDKASPEEQKMIKTTLGQVFSMMKAEMEKQGDEIKDLKVGGVVYNADKSKAEVPVIMVVKDKSGKTKEMSAPVNLGKIDGQWKIIFK